MSAEKLIGIKNRALLVYQYTNELTPEQADELALWSAILNYPAYFTLNPDVDFADWYDMCYFNWSHIKPKDFKRYRQCLAKEISSFISRNPDMWDELVLLLLDELDERTKLYNLMRSTQSIPHLKLVK